MPEHPNAPLTPLLQAWRARSSGAFTMGSSAGECTVVLKSGRIVQVTGPALLQGAAPGLALRGDLIADLGAVAAAGAPIDRAMAEAGVALGQALVRHLEMPEPRSGFTPGVAALPGAFPLPVELPRLLVKALREGRSQEAVDARARALAEAELRPVDGAAADLDPPALRMLNRCRPGRRVAELIELDAAGGAAREAAARRSLDLLIELGAVEVIEAAAPPPPPPPPSVDEGRLTELETLAARMSSLSPLEALGIPPDEPAEQITRERVERAFRAMARDWHPDRFAGQPAAVQDAAAAVFAQLNEHTARLNAPGALDEARARLAARQRGEPYVTELERERARVLFRKAEQVERTRAWGHGRELLAQAMALDPLAPMPRVLDAFFAVVLKERSADAAIAEIQELKLRTGREKGEAAYRVGRLHRLAGRDAPAAACFKAALEHNPTHLDAQRELRLLERRAAEAKR